jgi:uncharacterized protein YjbI with pentapeptide repeats
MCRVLKQSRSGYYAWCNRLVSARTQENAILSDQIQHIYDTSRQSYGSPRIQAALVAQGLTISRQLNLSSLQQARLNDAHLQAAQLTNTNLRWASLQGANLQAACLDAAHLEGASLTGADLKGVSLHETQLKDTQLDDQSLGRDES